MSSRIARSLGSRLSQTKMIRISAHVSKQVKCSLIIKDYKLVDTNALAPISEVFMPFVYGTEAIHYHPIGQRFGYPPAALVGSCFPVAPNIFATAKHAIFDDDYSKAGYQLGNVVVRAGSTTTTHFVCDVLPELQKSIVEEKDPVTGEEWILPKDYCLLRVRGSGVLSSFLLPKAAHEGDTIIFPTQQPSVDPETVSDIQFALTEELSKDSSWEEAEQVVSGLNISLEHVVSCVRAGALLQGKGNVIKLADGLMAHDSTFIRGMSGTFGSTQNGTFSALGISAGLGVYKPGCNYNVAIDINRADFKEDYAHYVLPALPKDVREEAKKIH